MSGDRALSARVVGFCRHLREAGIALGLGEQADAARAAALALHDPERFRMALRAATAKNRDEQEVFDACYPVYWEDLVQADLAEPDPAESVLPPLRHPAARQAVGAVRGRLQRWPCDREVSAAAYSPQQVPARTDFALLSADELEQMSHLLLAIGRQLARSLSRRYQPGTRGVAARPAPHPARRPAVGRAARPGAAAPPPAAAEAGADLRRQQVDGPVQPLS